MKIGDLVRPDEDEESMFRDPYRMNPGRDAIEFRWSGDETGVIVEVNRDGFEHSYYPVKILVGGRSGWTYSDYVEVVSE